MQRSLLSIVQSGGQVLAWMLIIGLSLYFFMDNVVAYLFGYRSPIFGSSLLNNQLWVVMHLLGGSLALLLGPLQFWPWLRRRSLALHRAAGRAYLLGILLIGISALRLSLVSPCVPCRISLLLLTLFTLLASGLAWRAILKRDIQTHRQMMVRSYVCVLAFVAVRIDDVFSLNFLFGSLEDPLLRRVVNEYFFSFVPLILAEIIMVWWPAAATKKPARRRPATAA
ncbi:DUF2306 domain-containing protein [Cesiribacter andamanensis]|uniref:DUF2306 domain-containing protein n=1 Tax=Cesiribacter andamanensis AMV16 TaxID=1279009 RepID=M7N6D7_9BACT|nr:DUF2306 domain-containing protein [Cesiribacter andamanensis]EMR02776.1 hypothetical protein ADICEAN_02104 [Cesiribacter andamanensis AMV16]